MTPLHWTVDPTDWQVPGAAQIADDGHRGHRARLDRAAARRRRRPAGHRGRAAPASCPNLTSRFQAGGAAGRRGQLSRPGPARRRRPHPAPETAGPGGRGRHAVTGGAGRSGTETGRGTGRTGPRRGATTVTDEHGESSRPVTRTTGSARPRSPRCWPSPGSPGDADGADPLRRARPAPAARPARAAPVHLTARADRRHPDRVRAPGHHRPDGRRRGGAGGAPGCPAARAPDGRWPGASSRRLAGPVRAWAHGDHPSAAALAVDLGLDRARVLWQLRRSLTAPLADARAARRGDAARLPARRGRRRLAGASTRAAFAEHPEQGRWTADDLRVRLAEPWFDPAGFLLAVDEPTGRLLGFHWTKVHERPGVGPDRRGLRARRGPGAHGGGLGRALTAAGLAHLRDQRGPGPGDALRRRVEHRRRGAL